MDKVLYLIAQYSIIILSIIYFFLAVLFFASRHWAKGVYWVGACILNIGVLFMKG